jgi:hypothetical protein
MLISVGLAVFVVVWTEWSDGVQLAVAVILIVIGIVTGAVLYLALLPWPTSD